MQVGTQIGRGQGLAAGGIALRRHARQPGLGISHLGRVGLNELRAEPAARGRLSQGRHGRMRAVTQHGGALMPALRRTDPGRTVAHHHALEALARVDTQPEASVPPHRETTKRGLLDVQSVQHGEHVLPQIVKAVGAGRDRAATMTSCVVADQAVAF